MSLFERLKNGLEKTKTGFFEKAGSIFSRSNVDEKTIEELEELLITSDVGVGVAQEIVSFLREKVKNREIPEGSSLRDSLKREMKTVLGFATPVALSDEKPYVILALGVNGAGKTTTIGKLAGRFTAKGYSVMLAASDTFRAAAIEQLEIWAKRTGALIVKHQSGSDPAAVAYDAIRSAIHKKIDIVIIDTAGRLHTKTPLMEELKKVKRVIEKAMPGAPHEVILVIDATNGQNALRQAELFHKAVGVTGVALTKLDGTARGGIVFAIRKDIGIPIKLIGIGEGVDDLRDFEPEEFVEALFS